MQVDNAKCVGCGNCVAVCPMGAIHVETRLAHINQDECVECGACIRFVTSEAALPWLVRTTRRLLSFLNVRYDQPIDLCPTGALYRDDLQWPRTLRAEFSDPLIPHPSTGGTGRGTEEIKTNDATNRLPPGRAGVLVEFGRPGIGCRFREVQKVTRAMARIQDLTFEVKNPVTAVMKDTSTGKLDPTVLDEKFLSCILEALMPMERVPDALEAIKKGYVQREIMRSAYSYQKAVDSGEQVVVGVNMFATEEKPRLKLLEIDESVERKQVERLKKLRRERDSAKVKQVLDKVRQSAHSKENVMPALIEAVKAYATVGEITDAFRDVFGEYREPSIV